MPDNPWLGKAVDDVGSGARDRLAEPHTDPKWDGRQPCDFGTPPSAAVFLLILEERAVEGRQ